MNSIYANQDVDKCESSFAPHLPTTDDPCKQFYKFGRLGQATEGRAKRRIFAIGNYVNQRLLKPVMNWLMEVLRRLPPDGTFHQTAPLSRIKNRSCYYSYDLTAATDRMPLRVLFHVMATLFSPSFASACVNSVLAMNLFEVPFVKGKDSDKVSTVSFVVAAEQVYPGKRFLDYSLLGDDIVIADERVAIAYRAIMSELQADPLILICWRKLQGGSSISGAALSAGELLFLDLNLPPVDEAEPEILDLNLPPVDEAPPSREILDLDLNAPLPDPEPEVEIVPVVPGDDQHVPPIQEDNPITFHLQNDEQRESLEQMLHSVKERCIMKFRNELIVNKRSRKWKSWKSESSAYESTVVERYLQERLRQLRNWGWDEETVYREVGNWSLGLETNIKHSEFYRGLLEILRKGD
ncbi:hypothetical protein GUJ93_ZPchr0138g35 [Zizania palustris]|uniref:Uncharacterized protein n=1 Tax=Zizania palustris TaxID=103762 RepID=A0A8J5REH4_ZIZPA|nr:hypothetical protein GUJ93_ZPchr0138g35 [Zizania palustris]